jgi:DNA polymerase II
MISVKAFIVAAEWTDKGGRNELRFYCRSESGEFVEFLVDKIPPVFFVEEKVPAAAISVKHKRVKSELLSFDGKRVDIIYFNTIRDLKRAVKELEDLKYKVYEGDVDPLKRFLMERFIYAQVELTGELSKMGSKLFFKNPIVKAANCTPLLKTVSIDIETDRMNSVYSAAFHLKFGESEKKLVLMRGDGENREWLHYYKSERELLEGVKNYILAEDPDIIIGWHVVGFDLNILEKRGSELNIPFNIGRGGRGISLRKRDNGSYFVNVPGRVVMDGPQSLRVSFYNFDDYSLESVSNKLLGRGKLIAGNEDKGEEIERLFEEDKVRLAEYNLNDAVLVTEIFKVTGLVELAVKRAQISGMLLDQLGSMTGAFDHFMLPNIHRGGYVASSVKDVEGGEHAAGGFVMDPAAGIYEDVVVLDFTSLYPTIILTFKIDPFSNLLKHADPLNTPAGYRFSGTHHFLPERIEKLLKQRREAKEKKDSYLSMAIKILMNSFYGVMGSYGCRFYDNALPSAITGTGKWLLIKSREYLEEKGYKVLYGDTDSLFVKLKEGEGVTGEETGRRLAADLNDYWRVRLKKEFKVDSYLELKFEKFYRRFILTQARGGEGGAKKRYAGLIRRGNDEEIEFVGMEAVRSDWTRLAKDFQEELYRKVFNYEDPSDYIKEVVRGLKEGEFNDKLIYRKRLRKDLSDYVKNVPPQVKAARLGVIKGNRVEYLITRRGPVPVVMESSDIDYNHYIEKQLKPVADSLLQLMGRSFDEILGGEQLDFFD